MAQKTDLFSILTAYASRSGSPVIEIDGFLSFIEKYAVQQSPEHPEWKKWTSEVPVKFWGELSPLVDAGKCEIQGHGEEAASGGKVALLSWYADKIEQGYRSVDEGAGNPFPDDKAFKFHLPADQVRVISVGMDLLDYLNAPQEASMQVVRLIFPEEFGSALALANMIPRRLLESSLLKIRSYLRAHGGRDYAMHKLPPQVTERELHLRDMLNQIQTRPLECIRAIEESEDFANLFWTCFCSLIKNDVRRGKDRETGDIAAIQAAFLLEIFNSFYKAGVMRERERELALRTLESSLDKAPYLYTITMITKFTNTKGALLLGQYSQGELEAWLKKKTTESKNGGLPELLILTLDDEKWFIKKKNVFPHIAKLLLEAKLLVKKSMERRWLRMLTTYGKEPAMEDDLAFEKLLTNYTAELCPAFSNILNDAKLPVLFQELEQGGANGGDLSSLFIGADRASFTELYALKRKSFLADTRILLPFWYSIPFLVAIFGFFAGVGKKKPEKAAREGGETPEKALDRAGEREALKELRQAGKEIEAAVVPGDYSLEDYLSELEDRWSRLLDEDARKKLVEDVRALVRDHYRYHLRTKKNVHFNREMLTQMAENIIAVTPALKKLGDQKSLRTYIVAFLSQLMQSGKA